jgi:uncharacterized membrane protein
MRARAFAPIAALAAASFLCVLMLVVRKELFGAAEYGGLVWNLFLAWIPFVVAIALLAVYRRGSRGPELLVLGALWLLFLPNAPYMLTDFVHLGLEHRLFDTMIIGAFALTSVALGFGSLLLVQLVATRVAGAAVGWLVALGSLFLSSVGIYLGRVWRLNSWDVVQRPRLVGSLLRSGLEDPFAHHYPLGFVLSVCGLLTLVYVGLYGFAAVAATVRD